MKSHYCRASSTKQYLHADLTVTKMYNVFLEEHDSDNVTPCIDLYRKVFRSLNLSFHLPKKDQYSLCLTYRQGNEEVKNNLRNRYEKHIKEKEVIREIKRNIKRQTDEKKKSSACLCFDLQ